MPLARPKRIPKWTQFGILVFNTVWTCFMYYKPVRWVQCGPITHFLHFANVTGTPNTIFLSFVKPVQTGAASGLENDRKIVFGVAVTFPKCRKCVSGPQRVQRTGL